MIDEQEPVEEIHLTAHVAPTEETVPEQQAVRVRFDLVQKNRSRGIYRQFAVCSDNRLHVLEQALRQKRRYQVGLAYLDPNPDRQFIIAKRWLYLTAAMLVICLGVSFAAQTALATKSPLPLAPFAIAGGAFTLVFFLAAVYQSRLLLRYHTRHGGLELVELLWGRPSRRHYHDFVARLSGAIREAQKRYNGELEQALVDELREHRRLHEEGIIDPAGYETAKIRILAAHGNPKVT